MKTKPSPKSKQSGIFIIPAIWWVVIGAAVIIPPVFVAVVMFIVSLLMTELEPPVAPPAGPSPEEMQSPVNRCDCGGNCLEVEP